MDQTQTDRILSVSDLTQYIKNMFDAEPFLAQVLVEGEISNFVHNSSGHLYFTLKDEDAAISCCMWRREAMSLPFEPKDGDKIYAKGSVSVFPKSGRYQLYVQAMKKQGTGDLFERYEALKKKLELKGYFDKSHKKPLPEFPKNIALLTSPTGAVIEDLKSIILKRSQFSNLILYPTKVQGDDAKDSIVKNIKKANDDPLVDVIILARGGGSLEDLWPFNEETVADAIYNSNKPIISAVGHETDFTIADFTADLRAATPSDAALIVVKDNRDLLQVLDALTLRLNTDYSNHLEELKTSIDKVMNLPIFRTPEKLLIDKEQALMSLSDKLSLLSPLNVLAQKKEAISNDVKHLENAYQSIYQKAESRFQIINAKLNLLNPLAVLEKGYSITYKDGKALRNASELCIGDQIETKLENGTVISKVTDRRN